MNFRMTIMAGVALALAGCTTIAAPTTNPVAARWNGQPAGIFFAQFGPPTGDMTSGGNTLYAWKGGYRKRGALRLSCTVELKVSPDYVIRDIRIVSDRKTDTGASWCGEFLTGA